MSELDRLEAQHVAEEAADAGRDLLEELRPVGLRRPAGGALPQSTAWLERLYAGDRMAREKKPGVFDHLRSHGPWMVSVDESPLAVIDGMSQTATVCAGFAEDEVVRAYVEGEFAAASVLAEDTSLTEEVDGEAVVTETHTRAFADLLAAQLPGLPHVTFTNGGAESVEKAFALVRPHSARPTAKRVLAFEGSFHGRTLLALHATWNPAKRGPFELAGCEARFAPFPVWQIPQHDDPPEPEGWMDAARTGDVTAMQAKWGGATDAFIAAEVASLARVDEHLREGECFCCIVEPMQSEGGDRYGTPRFFRALRALTAHHGIPLIFDEVQTGFGLGTSFFWHTRFRLETPPDAVTVAKRAQVGVVVSQYPDPEPTSAHGASLARGRIHAEMMLANPDEASRVEALVWPRLLAVVEKYPKLTAAPRATGFAFAFDMPSAELRNQYISQRFYRGVVVFGAGAKTVRYRLGNCYGERELDLLFDAVDASLAWLTENPGQAPPKWMDPSPSDERPVPSDDVVLREASPDEIETLLPQILALEAEVYEPARRDPERRLRMGFAPEGVALVAEENGQLLGYAVGGPVEWVTELDGPGQDPFTGEDDTFHSIAISVSPRAHGKGIGRRLKIEQLRAARAKENEDGTPRYRWATSRNRVGHTGAMMHINAAVGAHCAIRLENQYGGEGEAIYWRIPLRGLGRATPTPASDTIDCRQGVSRPFETPPANLRKAEESGALAGPTITKITICNYISPAIVRALEWVGKLVPDHPHLYLTSGRDECADKAVRTLRYYRKEAAVVLGWNGGYVGHTTSVARSISDPAVHQQGAPVFDWPRLPHPADVGSEAAAQAIRDAVIAAGGPDKVLGLFLEPLQERTGRTVPADFWPLLARIRRELDIPLVTFESAGACYRTGRGPFPTTALPVTPDILCWWGGGQTGFVHLQRRYFIDKPLMMVSTWDGDELSLVRLHHQLRAARLLDLAPAIAATNAALAGVDHQGSGLYRVLASAPDDVPGLLLRKLPGGRAVFAPPLDRALDAAKRLHAAFQ